MLHQVLLNVFGMNHRYQMHTIETRKRAYEKIKQRKKDWIEANGPCKRCGTWKDLEIDHVNWETKDRAISKHLWSSCEQKRNIELAKCQILCSRCHQQKSILEAIHRQTGKKVPRDRTPSKELVDEMVVLRDSGWSFRQIGEKYGYYHSTVLRNIVNYSGRSSSNGRALAL